MEDNRIIKGNLEINAKEGYVLVSVNPQFYTAEVAMSAAYLFLDRCYVLVDGDPGQEIFVELRPKKKVDLEDIGRDFNNELVNYANLAMSTIRNQDVRDEILKRVLKSNGSKSKKK